MCFVCLSVSSLDQGCDRVSSSWLLLSLERPLLHSMHTRWVQGEPLAVERGLRGLGPSRLRARGAPQRSAHTPLGDTGTGSAGSAPTSSALREHADGPPLTPGKSRHSLLRSKLRKRARRAATTRLRICLPTRRELLGDKPVSRASPCPPPRRLAGRLAPASARGLREQQTAAGLCVCVAVGPAVARGSWRPWTQSDAALRPS